jgi:glucose-1-phosphate adenylyltransferase
MNMQDVLGLVLGGGQGTRLSPLTRERSKPAVPLAGKYRLIDIPMSNCFHAGIEKIAILTQFNSASLHRHLYGTYNRDMFTRGWVQILAAEQTPLGTDWYQGTADAVRKQWAEIGTAGTSYTLILSGDHLYRMDYKAFGDFHEQSGADISIAVQPCSREEATGFGLLKLDDQSRIVQFREKPKDAKSLDEMVSRPNSDQPYMASMGIYFFRTSVLHELLTENPGNDFGKELIPAAIDRYKVMGYVFDGFWADIGTIPAFYQVNLDLTRPNPRFDFFNAERPIYTRPRFLPGSQVHGGLLNDVVMGDGCRLYNATVRSSVVGLRSVVRDGATLNNVIMMGADYYETEESLAASRKAKIPPIGIGESTLIDHAIIDKNARIGRNVVIRYQPGAPDEDTDNWVRRDGLVVVVKNGVIPDGTVI